MVSMVHAEARLFWVARQLDGRLVRSRDPAPHRGYGGQALKRSSAEASLKQRPSRVRRLRDALASGRQPRARAPACYPTSAHGALRIAHTHMHTHTHMYMCMCVCMCMCACACVCVCVCVCSRRAERAESERRRT